MKNITNYEIIIIGAGISGCVLAERFASQQNKKVLVLEKRNNIGGNCYDFYNNENILIPLYGPHFFHTNNTQVYDYINKFSKWIKYEHRVLSYVDNLLVPIPVNISTVNKLFKKNIKNAIAMKKWINKHTMQIKNPKNSEEAALRRVGKMLYEKIFKNYTKKQWGLLPTELDASIMDRIPIHLNFDDRYFKDRYQVIPKYGYAKFFKKMLKHPNINVQLETDYFNISKNITGWKKIFYTGPIDNFFNYKYGKLPYRSLNFEYETLNKEYYQPVAQVNYPDFKFKFTRITEPKHATKQKNKKTTIIREYSAEEGDPYYPILNKKNNSLFEQYQKEAKVLEKKGIYFVGRLANYKYFNMDEAFKNALDVYKKTLN